MEKTNITRSVIILLGFFLLALLPSIKQSLEISFPRISDNRYIQLLFIRFLYYSPMILAVLLVFGKDFVRILGLQHAPLIPFAYAVFSCIPMFILYAIFFQPMDPVDTFEIYNKAFISPIFEEIGYRALFFGTLYGYLGWKFWHVVSINALFFSMGHLYQGYDILSTVLTVLITSIACVWWGWLYVRWGYNLWLPVFLHILMNFAFEFFQVSGGAASGGIATYLGRFLVIAISVWLTLKYTEKMKRLSPRERKLSPSEAVSTL